ncbi:unnamed protein product, partial [Brassica oleracea]
MSSSSSRNWAIDVFPSFRGEDIRKQFLSHFRDEMDRKSITAFVDNEIDKGQSLSPVLIQAIKDSRIAIVIFTKNYASSAWCLNELLEIVKCKQELGQIVIPVFYCVDPSEVRKQEGDFGEIFKKTCQDYKKTKDEIQLWRDALTSVANLTGFDSKNWESDAKLIKDILSNILKELNITPSKDFQNFPGIEDHYEKMIALLDLESEEVRMVGIWGPSGIGKTTIARDLFSRLSRHFQSSVFIDRRIVSESKEGYIKCNPIDYNMKLHLQEKFLSKLLDEEGMKVNHLGAVKGKLKHRKVLIIIDDLDDQMVLDALAGGHEWFGPGSRIIAITKDKHILSSHRIEHIYEVDFPSEKVALQIFCQSAFNQNSPPDGFMELASEVAERAGGLPLGLNVLGASMRDRKHKYWVDTLPTLRKGLDKSIEKTLRFTYEELEREDDKALFRHIACLFNGDEVNYIELMLSELNASKSLEHLVDKSLIRKILSDNNTNSVEMHCLVQEMGKEMVRAQSKTPGEREFLMDSKDVCNVLKDGTGTQEVLGISLDLDDIDEAQIHEKAFTRMSSLHFLKFYKKSLGGKKEVIWGKLPKTLYFPEELKLLTWPGYPMACMPSNFCPKNLVELRMPNSKLKSLWEGVKPLTFLKDIDLSESKNLKKIPDLSTATNLETLNLRGCSSLVKLPSSIGNLSSLKDLNMAGCTKLESLPKGINLKSLIRFNLSGCFKLRNYHGISDKTSVLHLNKTAIKTFSSFGLENVVELHLEQITSKGLWKGVQPLPSLKKIISTNISTLNLNQTAIKEIPTSIKNLLNLEYMEMRRCKNLKILPTGIDLISLYHLDLNGCSRLSSFPDFSRNIAILYLNQTGIREVPPWIIDFSNLETLEMWECRELYHISPEIFKLPNLLEVFFSECKKLTEVRWPENTEDNNNTFTNLSLVSFIDCFSSNQEAFIQQSASEYMIFPGEVPPYFTHQSTGSSLNIPLHHFSLFKRTFLDFKACAVVDSDLVVDPTVKDKLCFIDIEVECKFRDKHGNYFGPAKPKCVSLHLKYNHQIIFDCRFPLDQACDQVMITFKLPSSRLKLKEKLKGCGVRLLD